jgi:ferric iron reductase protein FhuF
VLNKKTNDIFNYDFEWIPSKKELLKDTCCEKFKKKGEKKCKNCPKRKFK